MDTFACLSLLRVQKKWYKSQFTIYYYYYNLQPCVPQRVSVIKQNVQQNIQRRTNEDLPCIKNNSPTISGTMSSDALYKTTNKPVVSKLLTSQETKLNLTPEFTRKHNWVPNTTGQRWSKFPNRNYDTKCLQCWLSEHHYDDQISKLVRRYNSRIQFIMHLHVICN